MFVQIHATNDKHLYVFNFAIGAKITYTCVYCTHEK